MIAGEDRGGAQRLVARMLRLRKLPLRVVVARGAARAAAPILRSAARRRDGRTPTSLPRDGLLSGATARLFAGLRPLEVPEAYRRTLAGVAALALRHRADLLGSGWVSIGYDADVPGFEGHRYDAGVCAPCPGAPDDRLAGLVPDAALSASRAAWRLIDRDYEPIDWQRDLRSGHRWSARTWYRDVALAPVPGADVKLPWELARMQHLPQLALAALLSAGGAQREGAAFEPPGRYAREIRNQLLDFVATNPPRFGVNWAMPMDVGIRVANWVVALELLQAAGEALDPDAERVVRRSVQEHAEHLATHFEWLPELRGNHYLADVVGLLFAAAWLPRSGRTDAWLALAVQELREEILAQFLPDGGNFEASTVYHRLSAEMVVYGTALVLGLPSAAREALARPQRLRVRGPRLRREPVVPARVDGRWEPFPPAAVERLERAIDFTARLTKRDGRVPQIGDNDSGRFFKLRVPYVPLAPDDALARYANLERVGVADVGQIYWDEDVLDHRHLLDAGAGLFDRQDWIRCSGCALEAPLVAALAGGQRLAAVGPAHVARTVGAPRSLPSERPAATLEIPVPSGALDGLETAALPDFGVYLFRSPRLYLLVRCGPVGQGGIGGHAHNDQLAIELAVDGRDLIADPGTYVYTAAPPLRNAYRSVAAHFAPRCDFGEPYRLDLGLFQLGGDADARCDGFGPDGFDGVLRVGRAELRLRVRFAARAVRLHYETDGCRLVDLPTDWRAWRAGVAYSPGYGKLLRTALPDPNAESAGPSA